MIDCLNHRAMKLDEVHVLFKWTLKAIGKVTSKHMPRSQTIEIISFKAFNSADRNVSGSLDLSEMENWIELN